MERLYAVRTSHGKLRAPDTMQDWVRQQFGDLAAVAATGAALLLRMVLDPVLPPGFPYLTFFPAVVLTAFFFGLRPGIICAVLSGLAAWYCVSLTERPAKRARLGVRWYRLP